MRGDDLVSGLPVRGDDLGEQLSKQLDGGSCQRHGRREGGRGVLPPIAEREGVVLKVTASHTAAMELRGEGREEAHQTTPNQPLLKTGTQPCRPTEGPETGCDVTHPLLDGAAAQGAEGGAQQHQVVVVTERGEQGEVGARLGGVLRAGQVAEQLLHHHAVAL